MLKQEGPVYLPLTEPGSKQTNNKPCRPIFTKLLIIICSLAEISFICTAFILQVAYGQSTTTLEFGKRSPAFRWGIWLTYYAMAVVGCYRIWCYYSATWKLQNTPDANIKTHNTVSCCGISLAVLSFALEMTFLSLTVTSSAGLPGAPRLIMIAALQLLLVASCRAALEVARNSRSPCSLSGPLVLIHVLHILLLATFLPIYGPLKGPCYSGLDYDSHIITAQCKPGQDSISAPCWLENNTHPLTLSMDSILNHKPKAVSFTTPFKVSFDGETKKMAMVVSYQEKSWLPKVFSAKVPQFSCAILEPSYCRSCSIEELSRLQVQISVGSNMEDGGVEVHRENDNTRCLLPQAFEMMHNSSLSFKYCLSEGYKD